MAYTAIDDPEAYFQTKLYTGTGSAASITLDGDTDMQPDLVWFKKRSSVESHYLYDAVRGVTKELISDSNAAQSTVAEGVTAFGSDGFTLTTAGGDYNVNRNTDTYVGWFWKETADAGFDMVAYTGTGSAASITLDGDTDMQPDLVWFKKRSSVESHYLYDAVRGVTKEIYANSTAAEDTDANSLTGFNSDGFSIGNANQLSESSETMVAWNWKASGSTASNSSGDITSTVSASTASGFSIVSYTGNGSDGATLGHSLGTTPEMVIQKRRSGSTASWVVWHKSIHDASSNDKVIYLNLTNATASGASDAIGGVSSTLITTKGTGAVNPSGDTCIAYCFASIQGFSKFGSYTGNGNADGTFVYTGFKPAYLLLKDSSSGSAYNWVILDNKRDPSNGIDRRLQASGSVAEYTDVSNLCDFVSNGFKWTTSNANWNASGVNYIYMAFAEAPFVNSNGVPCNAR